MDEKLSQVTWAWLRADKQRVAYRQKLCLTCFSARFLALEPNYDPTGPLTCPTCGIVTETDYDAVYGTAYVPGHGKMQIELATCGPCAVEVRNRAMENAELLENREQGLGAAAPNTTTLVDPWAALGIARAD